MSHHWPGNRPMSLSETNALTAMRHRRDLRIGATIETMGKPTGFLGDSVFAEKSMVKCFRWQLTETGRSIIIITVHRWSVPASLWVEFPFGE